MQEAQARADSVRLVSVDSAVWAVIRYTMLAATAGVGFFVVGALWMSTCTGATGLDTAACGPVQRALLDLGAPLILIAAAAWAFWRGRGGLQGATWFGAGAVLLVLTVATVIPVS
ncbi:hypothetical protein ACTXG7_07405 [Mycolicibacterium sp. Dal123E01]|uniref:hypothetical protein n=1 Tax=Mycolicibacterium sp. Dal123E01 TaxID=3457578 RepID=UPI00403E7646